MTRKMSIIMRLPWKLALFLLRLSGQAASRSESPGLLADGFENSDFAQSGGLYYKNNAEQDAGTVEFQAKWRSGMGALNLQSNPTATSRGRLQRACRNLGAARSRVPMIRGSGTLRRELQSPSARRSSLCHRPWNARSPAPKETHPFLHSGSIR